MDPTPENAPCWQDQYRPREIYQGPHRIMLKLRGATVLCVYIYVYIYRCSYSVRLACPEADLYNTSRRIGCTTPPDALGHIKCRHKVPMLRKGPFPKNSSITMLIHAHWDDGLWFADIFCHK